MTNENKKRINEIENEIIDINQKEKTLTKRKELNKIGDDEYNLEIEELEFEKRKLMEEEFQLEEQENDND